MTFERVLSQDDAREAVWYIWKRTRLKGAVVAWLVDLLLGAYVGSKVSGAPFLWIFPVILVVRRARGARAHAVVSYSSPVTDHGEARAGSRPRKVDRRRSGDLHRKL